MNEEKSNDPLSVLVKSSDYMEGYKEGRIAYSKVVNKTALELRGIADHLDSSFDITRKKKGRPGVKIYGIKNRNILLSMSFDTKEEAWKKIYEICGDKIDPEDGHFKVVKL